MHFSLFLKGYVSERQHTSKVVNYDFKTKTAQQQERMVKSLHSSAAAVLGTEIFLCGGYDGSYYLNLVQRFSPKNNTWTEVGPLNQKRSGAGVISINDNIYVIGGYDGYNYLNSCEKDDRKSNKWSNIKVFNTPRQFPAIASMDGKIYVCGGKVSNGSSTNSVEIYDPVTDTWSFAASMIDKRSELALVSYNRKLYAIGGYDESTRTYLSSAEVYHPERNCWNFVTSLPTAASAMSYGVGPPN